MQLKSCSVNTKYIWPYFNIMLERVNKMGDLKKLYQISGKTTVTELFALEGFTVTWLIMSE